MKKITRWLRSRAGLAVVAGSLLVILLLTVAGFGLGWWSLAARTLRGTAGERQTASELSLLFFTATAQNGHVVLNWETQGEQNLQGFDLYRAEGAGDAFGRLNEAPLPCQASESITETNYEFIDPAVTTGVTYTYRLECMAMQGTSMYSSTATVEVPRVETGLPPVPPGARHHVFLPLVLKGQ